MLIIARSVPELGDSSSFTELAFRAAMVDAAGALAGNWFWEALARSPDARGGVAGGTRHQSGHGFAGVDWGTGVRRVNGSSRGTALTTGISFGLPFWDAMEISQAHGDDFPKLGLFPKPVDAMRKADRTGWNSGWGVTAFGHGIMNWFGDSTRPDSRVRFAGRIEALRTVRHCFNAVP